MFDAIPGQRRAKELFERALADDRLSHAYLFTGPEGLAKTAFAREVGCALVCDCGGCGACPACERARRGLNPDLHELEREGELIRIGQIDPVVEELALKPFGATRRAWVIPEVEYLTPEAANKLLKSIEEPPDDVYFLLVTDRFERVLPTIVSRCQLVEFSPISDEEVAAYLAAESGLAGPRGDALARVAAGSVERAARLAADARGPDRRSQYLRYTAELLRAINGPDALQHQTAFLTVLRGHFEEIKADVAARLAARSAEIQRQFQDPNDKDCVRHVKHAEALAKREEARRRRTAAVDALEIVAAWVRDLWVAACGASDVLWNSDRADELAGAAVATPEFYRRLLEVAAATRKDLYLNVDFELALRAMFSHFEEVAERA